MRTTAHGSVATCLLIATISLLASGSTAEAGSRGKDPGLQGIDAALEGAQENAKSGKRLVQDILGDIDRTIKVLANRRTVVAAKGGSKSVAELPDVCKTPSPAGPVPIPYPNVGKATDTTKGTKKVKVGGRPAAIKGADYAARAATDEENSSALLDYLRKVRSEVEARKEFVTGICKKCRMLKADKWELQQWLLATKKGMRRTPSRFDDHVRRIEQARRSHLKQMKSSR